jgi:hypothetical protein
MIIRELCAACGKRSDLQVARCVGGCNEEAPLCAECLEEFGAGYTCEVCQEEHEQEEYGEAA